MPSYLSYYFAGVTTAGIALVAGFGGALIFSNAVLSKKPLSPTRLERVAKQVPQDQILQAKNDFPAQAAPVINTPQFSQPVAFPIAAGASREAKPVVQTERFERPNTVPTVEEYERADPPRQQIPEVREIPNTASPVNPATEKLPILVHPGKEKAIATAKRRREIELLESTRLERKRHASKKQQEIATAADAVRRMLRDRQDLREDAMGRSFDMGFSSD